MLRVGVTYPRILLGLIVTDFLLTFVVPSGIARVVIMAAIALGLVEAFGAARGSNVARGMFLILSYTANIFDKMIIAGAGSITARGLIEKARRRRGALEPVVPGVPALQHHHAARRLAADLVALPARKGHARRRQGFCARNCAGWARSSAREWKAALLIAAAIVLWLTDFMHHISPAMIGIGVGLFALLPHVGILEIEDMRKLNYMPVFFVAAAVSMGTVMEATKGIDVLTQHVSSAGCSRSSPTSWRRPPSCTGRRSSIISCWRARFRCWARRFRWSWNLAKTNGFNPLQLGLIWTFAAGGKLFAYQSGVLIVGYSYGYFDARDLVKHGRLADAGGIRDPDAAGAVLLAADRHSVT